MSHDQDESGKNDFFYIDEDIYDEQLGPVTIGYEEMYETVVNSIPFSRNEKIRIMDIGIGTGMISKLIIKAFPNCSITGIDIFESLVDKARRNLKDFKEQVELKVSKMQDIEFEGKYDVIVSTLSIHHLENSEKKALFRKIFQHLKEGGCFINGDMVTFNHPHLKMLSDKIMEDYVMANLEDEKTVKEWLLHRKKVNIPAPIEDQMKWLEDIGFRDVSVVYRYYTTGAYVGYR